MPPRARTSHPQGRSEAKEGVLTPLTVRARWQAGGGGASTLPAAAARPTLRFGHDRIAGLAASTASYPCGASFETVETLAVDPASPPLQTSGEAKERVGMAIQSTTFLASPAARARIGGGQEVAPRRWCNARRTWNDEVGVGKIRHSSPAEPSRGAELEPSNRLVAPLGHATARPAQTFRARNVRAGEPLRRPFLRSRRLAHVLLASLAAHGMTALRLVKRRHSSPAEPSRGAELEPRRDSGPPWATQPRVQRKLAERALCARVSRYAALFALGSMSCSLRSPRME
jgi:hypothetical protein